MVSVCLVGLFELTCHTELRTTQSIELGYITFPGHNVLVLMKDLRLLFDTTNHLSQTQPPAAMLMTGHRAVERRRCVIWNSFRPSAWTVPATLTF